MILSGSWAYRVMRALSPHGSILDPLAAMANPRGQFPGRDRTIILIAGKDYNHTNKGIEYTTGSRSDTVMLLSVDLVTAKLTAVSIPRDTHVKAPDGITGKINATFQRGGIKLLRDTVASQFGVNADHYVVLKADAVKALVDAVGGVDVEAIDDMFYEDSWAGLKIDITKGQHRLGGSDAVGFVRFRKMGTHRIGPNGEKIPVHHSASLEEGDLRRTERQQQLMRALTHEALRPQNIAQAPHLLDVAFQQVETDLSRTQLLALAAIFRKSGGGDLSGASIPGKDDTIDGVYFWSPDLERSQLTMNWLLLGDITAGRKLMRVNVYNGSGRDGLARATANSLCEAGFAATSGGNLREKLGQSEVVFRKAVYEGFAREIAQKVGTTNVHKDTTDPRADWLPEITVRLGGDATVTPAAVPAHSP
ncbi:cell envelope-related transcriptional attenuator [Fimbriimonas ginsengisoli Gsoil 348]|uniref:Cell envelope-related transcriptional attenuator n=1 Tax=Fimbriimonas ginsengisoli Gsoil 348 TaxID=661478 RepID=A0A068NYR0_FIMGI|nr:cell envelope-related transcriptional attenuator [Fimbriimonas ginsengisoli Gsoil 348]